MASADQVPIGTGFRPDTTAAEILAHRDLAGLEAIVTGGASGLGIEIVRALAAAGASVTVPTRRVGPARAALSSLPGKITIDIMDLADLASVRAFSENWLARSQALHVLVNAASIAANPLTRIGPGWESQFAINHLGHFELTRRLAPALRSARRSRVVCLTSNAHHLTDVHWDDPHFRHHEYDRWQAHGQSMTANSLYAIGLDARWRDAGIRSYAVHPGIILSPSARRTADTLLADMGWDGSDDTLPGGYESFFKTPEQGAATPVWAAVSLDLDEIGGVYCEDADIAALASNPKERYRRVRRYAVDPEAASRLWAMSEAMIERA